MNDIRTNAWFYSKNRHFSLSISPFESGRDIGVAVFPETETARLVLIGYSASESLTWYGDTQGLESAMECLHRLDDSAHKAESANA